MVGLTMAVLLAGSSAAAEQPDPQRFAAQALALRAAAIEGTNAATTILATIPGSAPADVLPDLWHSFFENAIVKLGRLRAPAPVALYYNPLLDIALITDWEQKDGHYRVARIRALPGARLGAPTAAVPDQPAWMVADDPITTLAEVTATRLDTFRHAHPAEAHDAAGRDGVTFATASANMRATLPRLFMLPTDIVSVPGQQARYRCPPMLRGVMDDERDGHAYEDEGAQHDPDVLLHPRDGCAE